VINTIEKKKIHKSISVISSYGRIRGYESKFIYLMEISEPLYCNYAPNPTGKLLHTGQAYKSEEGDVTIALYEKYLVESSVRSKTYIIFDFDLKFSYQITPPSVSFEKNDSKSTYCLRTAADLQIWRDILRAKVNQRGFHEQFKPKKKIGKGNFASVYLA